MGTVWRLGEGVEYGVLCVCGGYDVWEGLMSMRACGKDLVCGEGIAAG